MELGSRERQSGAEGRASRGSFQQREKVWRTVDIESVNIHATSPEREHLLQEDDGPGRKASLEYDEL